MRSQRRLARRDDEPATPVAAEAPPAAARLDPSATPREAAEAAGTGPAGLARLQAARGNRFAADVALFRQPAPALPASADNLRRFRDGYPLLRSLAWERPPVGPAGGFVDLEPALRWLTQVVRALTIVEPLADPTSLVFESLLSHEFDDEYAAAETKIGPQIASSVALVAPIAQATGVRIRDTVVAAMNESTVVDADRAEDPAVAALDRVTAW